MLFLWSLVVVLSCFVFFVLGVVFYVFVMWIFRGSVLSMEFVFFFWFMWVLRVVVSNSLWWWGCGFGLVSFLFIVGLWGVGSCVGVGSFVVSLYIVLWRWLCGRLSSWVVFSGGICLYFLFLMVMGVWFFLVSFLGFSCIVWFVWLFVIFRRFLRIIVYFWSMYRWWFLIRFCFGSIVFYFWDFLSLSFV